MKRLLLALVLLAPAAHGQAKLLQSGGTSNGFSGATNALVLSSTKGLTAGSTILVQVESTCTAAPKLSDGSNRVYTLDSIVAGTEGGVSLFHAANTTTTFLSVKATLVNCGYAAMQFEEVSGLSGVVDATVTNATSALAGGSFTVGTLVTKGAGDFLVAGVHDNFGLGALTGQTGFTFLPATQSPAAAQWMVAGAAGNWTVMFGAKTGYRYTGAGVAYSSGGTPSPPPPNTCQGTGSMTVNGATNPLSMAGTFVMPGGTVGVSYSASVATAASVTGGTPPYTYSVTSGSLPAGLSMSTAGIISGTPSTAGTSSFAVTVADSSALTLILDMKIVAENNGGR